jgi:hypothetical protein
MDGLDLPENPYRWSKPPLSPAVSISKVITSKEMGTTGSKSTLKEKIMTKMQGPENAGGFSHDGQSYDADEDGVIDVPAHITSHAEAHGFKVITEKSAGNGEAVDKITRTGKLSKNGNGKNGKKSADAGDEDDAGNGEA